jgi:hypothetical protein
VTAPGLADRATSALHDLDGERVVALAGEFHSVVARPLAELAESRGLPFVCSSATLDKLTSAAAPSVGRIAAPQSHGWRVYADYVLAAGHAHDARSSRSALGPFVMGTIITIL